MAPAASTAREASAPGGAPSTPAEVETWGDDGGGLEAPATRPTWFRRTRVAITNSVWAPIAFKMVGLVLGMVALSGVGIVSILSGSHGVQVPLASMLGSDIHAAWLADKPAAITPARVAVAPVAVVTAAPSAASALSAPVTNPSAPSGPLGVAASDAKPAQAESNARTAGSASPGMTEDGKVVLNLAGVEDLRHLPGVGQKRADAIVALRTRLGRFKQVSDLLRVKGIGVRGLKKIMPHVLLDAPKPAA